MNNKVSNVKKEVSAGLKMNDKDYVNDILSSLKCITKDYAIVMTEASNEVLYEYYAEMFDDFSLMQRNVYELMFRNGWYELEKADDMKVEEKYNMLDKELADLNI